MARTTITPQSVTSAGRTPAYEPANVDGNLLRMARGRVLHVKNGSGASVTVTIPTPQTVDGLAVADRTVAVPAAGERLIALSTTDAYKQPGNAAHIDYSAVATVTVAVFDIP